MIDQLIIGDKASFDDFGASLAKSKKKPPKKKSIKETVPFSNRTYDFTRINGEIYWEERELEYIFEMTADTPEKLEEMKTAFAGWVMNVFEENIHDPFIPDYHFKGTFADMDFDDEEGMEKTTATVKFSAYPYKIANYPKVYSFHLYWDEENFHFVNNSHHEITPEITFPYPYYPLITFNGVTYDYTTGFNFKIPVGVTPVTIRNTEPFEMDVVITYREEVL